jgi:hypothetical protein
MATSPIPGPDDSSPLSARERQVLEGIEVDLAASDPHLAREMARRAGHGPVGWWPMSARCTVLLVLAQLVLVVASVLVPASWWAVLVLVTTLVVVPWFLLCALEKRREH